MIRYKRPTVQLTSLLDLLFLMIFISLIQAKNIENPTTDRIAKPIPAPEKVEEVKTVPTKAPAKKVVKKRPPPPPPKKVVMVTAVFNFYPSSKNPQLPSGSYKMRGDFNRETGALQLGGVSWVKQPKNYDMVPLKGRINKARNEFTGKIQFYGCKQFKLNLISPPNKRGSGISGSWKGEYTCLQGSTGLTLTID